MSGLVARLAVQLAQPPASVLLPDRFPMDVFQALPTILECYAEQA
jgi:hypothetical protein